MSDLSDEVEKALAFAEQALEWCDELEEELEAEREARRSLEAEVEDLRQRLADVEARDAIAETVVDASRLKVEERAAICIQTAVNEANQNGGAASMDYKQATAALGGGLDRRQLLDALERAGSIVDGDAVRFKKEPRSSNRNSRMVVDLEAGDLPRTVAGRELEVDSRT